MSIGRYTFDNTIPVRVEVSTVDVYIAKGSYVVYVLELTLYTEGSTKLRTMRLHKRFSDFVNLQTSLREEFKSSELPYELPNRQFGLWRKQNSLRDDVVRERRVKLAKFLSDMLNDSFDTKWKNSHATRDFLGLEHTKNWDSFVTEELVSASVSKGDNGDPNHALDLTKPECWLLQFKECKTELTECSQLLVNGERTRRLIRLRLQLNDLEKALQSAQNTTLLPHREVERRKYLLVTLRKDINELSIQQQTQEPQAQLPSATTQFMLMGTSPPNTHESGINSNTGTGNERMFVRGRPPSGRRRFGETSETVELDNQGLLQLHKSKLREQDEELEQLRAIIQRQKALSLEMNEELEGQNELLGIFSSEIVSTEGKLGVATRRAKEFNDNS